MRAHNQSTQTTAQSTFRQHFFSWFNSQNSVHARSHTCTLLFPYLLGFPSHPQNLFVSPNPPSPSALKWGLLQLPLTSTHIAGKVRKVFLQTRVTFPRCIQRLLAVPSRKNLNPCLIFHLHRASTDYIFWFREEDTMFIDGRHSWYG